MSEKEEQLRAQYSENQKITGGNYDKSLAVKCINGIFVIVEGTGIWVTPKYLSFTFAPWNLSRSKCEGSLMRTDNFLGCAP